ncbi:hypothetical protein TSOC_012596 [Tetrabaena socialis]|uniref:DUF4136 domain-containing protein n=1 Tax=Tetrabaena socialis TaxID=47790 RepID=A0A2J7ZMN1_9CHLO|nr:hypothetical protein TSOC_012596 [Tetrabaena socialis]|eukprot:PNH01510.1 hypothetical protein TSOC_012596 [Tetrabaena socialis]
MASQTGEAGRRPIVRKGAVLAVLAIALLSCAPTADAARRAFLGDLENADGRSGRKLLEAAPELEILAEVDYAVLDVLSADYDESIGSYGGLGVYGYYGSFTGVYGSYGGSLFVDYETIIDENTLISAEIPREEPPPRRRAMEEDVLVDLPVLVTDYAFDYAAVESPGGYGFYAGIGFGMYYGSVPVYAAYGGYGGGGITLDYEGVERWWETAMEADELLGRAVDEASSEDLMDNLDAGDPLFVVPKM